MDHYGTCQINPLKGMIHLSCTGVLQALPGVLQDGGNPARPQVPGAEAARDRDLLRRAVRPHQQGKEEGRSEEEEGKSCRGERDRGRENRENVKELHY